MDIVKIKLTVRTQVTGSKVYRDLMFDKAAWLDMSEQEQQDIINKQAMKMVTIDWQDVSGE